MARLADQVAVITGGANGIGRAAALRFLEEGARVVIGDVNDRNAQAVLEEAGRRGFGSRIRYARADVADEAQVRALFDAALAAFGGLDCVFNNAGIGGAFGPIAQTRVEDWDATLGVLLRGVFLGMKHGARILCSQGRGGSIVSTASIAAFAAGSGSHAYSAAKAAIVSLTRSVATELAPHRIRVNAVAPGPLMTDLFHRGREARAQQAILERQPWPVPGQPEDVADVVAFLASSDARLITGETVVVDGGLLARGPGLFERDGKDRMLEAVGMDRGSSGAVSDVRSIDPPGGQRTGKPAGVEAQRPAEGAAGRGADGKGERA